MKLSAASHWLLRYLAEVGMLSPVTPLPVHWSQQPGRVHMNGLVRRGWAEGLPSGLFRITDTGRKAASKVGPCPPVRSELAGL